MPAPAIIAGVLGIGEKLIDHWFPNAEEANKRKGELFTLLQQGKMKELESAASVISAEASSDHWLVAAWRPITMLVFVFIIANNYILAPYIELFFDRDISLPLPSDLWDLLKLGLGGYVIGRSGEKMVKAYKEGMA